MLLLESNDSTLVVRRLQGLVRQLQNYLSPVTYIFPILILNCLRDRLLFKFILLHQNYVGYTNMFFCEKLGFNTFSHTFVNFTIVILTWYNFTSYSIVLPRYENF